MKKQMVSTFLIALLMLLTAAPIYAYLSFTDVSSEDYYYDPVIWAVEKDITNGVSEKSFAPDDTCTRSQIVTFLWRAAGEPEPQININPFSDIKPSDYYYKAVLWAVEKDITNGIGEYKFGPDQGCTRGQVVTFLHRTALEVAPATVNHPFKDIVFSHYYYDAVLWAIENGITNGVSETSFAPEDTCTRGQIVTFLYRGYDAVDWDKINAYMTDKPIIPAPQHSDLYIEGVSVEDVIVYFREVCLDSEFSYGGNASLIQKWTGPITYKINGPATFEDIQKIKEFTAYLNTIPGFPGIYEAENTYGANLQIYFCTQPEMVDILGDDFHFSDGGVRYWYEDNAIWNGIICYRNDIDQYIRNSIILEEIYNGLGAVQDTVLRPDSIIYQYYATPQQLTEVDELILKLLYHPDIKCGMDAAQCGAVIRTLYY